MNKRFVKCFSTDTLSDLEREINKFAEQPDISLISVSLISISFGYKVLAVYEKIPISYGWFVE